MAHASREGTDTDMLNITTQTKVYLACGSTDMRRQINGLASMVQNSFDMDPYEGALFVFCNKARNRIKILVWEDNGFWMLFKRLERGHFKWPEHSDGNTMSLDIEDLKNLIRGPGLIQKLQRKEVIKSPRSG